MRLQMPRTHFVFITSNIKLDYYIPRMKYILVVDYSGFEFTYDVNMNNEFSYIAMIISDDEHYFWKDIII